MAFRPRIVFLVAASFSVLMSMGLAGPAVSGMAAPRVVAPGSSSVSLQQTTPASAAGWRAITAGGGHTCGTRVDGTAWCWGNNAESAASLSDAT